MARAVRVWTAAWMTRAGRFGPVRPLTCPPMRSLAVPRTRLARSVRACLPATGTVLGCFRAIRVPAGPGIRISARVRLPARAVATTGIGSGLTRSELPRTGPARPGLARTALTRSERPWSERSRSELLRAGRARPVMTSPVLVRTVLVRSVVVRTVVVRTVVAGAGLARMLFPARPAPTVLRSAGAVGLPRPPSA